MNQPSVLLFFIDGLGIGERNRDNPLAHTEKVEPLAHFREESSEVIFDGILTKTDPRMGIEGRPQSASGQTTILTGVNVPETLGYHKQGFPNEAMRRIIAEHSIFLQLKKLNIEPNVFANTYTPQFFQTTPRWKSATTCAVEAAELSFRRLPDLIGGFSLFHDFTNESLRERGFDVPPFSPEEAGEILAKIVSQNCFTLYEHFITDKIGHDQDFERAQSHLPKLALMIRTVLSNINFENTTVVLTSDHGNIEDLSVRNHTLNDVPTIIWGRKSHEIAAQIRTLADITPAVVRLLTS
jgi:2,3-bisphosphoglycerate-independent phosphoglycerate mutase